MRTTLDVDEDVLRAVEDLAVAEGTTAGRMLSELARRALGAEHEAEVRNGVPLLPPRPGAGIVTPNDVARLLAEEP